MHALSQPRMAISRREVLSKNKKKIFKNGIKKI